MTNREKFRVIPGLSLKGPDILQRLKNRSLTLNPIQGSVLEDASFADALRMDKVELINKMKENEKAIAEKRAKLSRNS